jgi:next-to-BRCA1 protein 1
MCTPCVTDRRTQHALSHEFFKIEEPGHVIVHTVFEGDGDFDPSRFTRRQQRANPRVDTHGGLDPVSHNATCDLCDSRIRGDRYVSLEAIPDSAANTCTV